MDHIVITGATDGIGKQVALEAAQLGHHVWLHGRDEQKCKSVMQEIIQVSHNKNVKFLVADLADLGQVQDLINTIYTVVPRLNVLINNAGLFAKLRVESAQGYEINFAVNYLAHFLLTTELLHLLEKNSPARIVNVSSRGHQRGVIDFKDLQYTSDYSGKQAYRNSKLMNVLFTQKLARELDSQRITINSVHPGVIQTNLLRAGWELIGSPVSEGAKTIMWAAFSEQVQGISGKYYADKQETVPSVTALDEQLQDRLWLETLQLIKPIE